MTLKLLNKSRCKIIQFFTGGNVNAAHTHGSDNTTDDTPLYNHHYMQWHRHTHTSQTKCIMCGKKFQKYSNSSLVPQPTLLQQFLTTNTESAFLHSFSSPVTLFNSVQQDNTHLKWHEQWLDLIPERIWTRIQFEEEMMPSSDALLRYWKRSCWVMNSWKQATPNNFTNPPLEDCGWKITGENTLLLTGTVQVTYQR